ncbi:SusC/RagA family TonB-linked outer membrane protein [Bacteroidia bacterium]|nr:SusC/RagA family TonB-linked outer membrane protein [Bacteroidia bacterium]
MRLKQIKRILSIMKLTFLILFIFATGVFATEIDSQTTTISITAKQQNERKITGTVIDARGEAVIGASVVEKGTANGVITDIDGKFTLNIPQNATLVISYIGYNTQEVAVGSRNDLSISLVESAFGLDEVVVVGYGTQKKRDLTGAVSSIKVADEPVGTFSTISHALAGKAAGLQVTQNSAQVGGGSTFRIRGATSTGAGNDPLVIIDGFPVSNTSNLGSGNRYDAGSMDNILESINPNDIESIEVLKDASSTAIYGSRAGHGVIIVTTKRGKAQKVNITYSGNASLQDIKNGYKMMDGPEYMNKRNQDIYEGYLKENGLDVYKDYISLNPGHVAPPYVPKFTDQEIANAITTDWVDEVTRTGFKQSHNISFNGGTESTKYLASLNYFNQRGVIKNNGMERFTAKINLDQQVSKYVKAGLSFNINRNQYDNVALGQNQWENAGVITAAISARPYSPIYDENGKYYIDPEISYQANPVSLLEITDKSTKDRILASAYTEVEPISGLVFKATFGADRRYAKRKNYLPKTMLHGAAVNGQANIYQRDDIDYLMELTATYTKQTGSHNFTILGGYSYQQFNWEGFNAGNSDFLMDAFLYNNLGAGAFAKPTVGSTAGKSALGSYFGRLNYSFLGKYLLTATVRADGASNFNPDYRWGTFPSASLGWRFSDEEFMSSLSSVLSNGKIRVGYGQTGNSNVGNRILNTYAAGYGYVFGDSYGIGIRANQLGNPMLTWETTGELNIGLDLGFFNNRISTSLEYYDRTISDLLVTNKSLLSYNEITTIASNIGKTRGKGFEWTLNTVNITNKDLFWSADLSFSIYRDKWKERDPNWKPAVYESATDPIRSNFNYLSDGLLQPGEKAPDHQKSLLPGQVKLKDLSGPDGKPDGILNDYDRVFIGSSDPDFLFGFNNTLKYKSFDFNIYFYGIVNALKGASYYETNQYTTKFMENWHHDYQQTDFPNSIVSDFGSGDYFNHKISYLRCRNITLGYVIPVARNIANRVRVYGDVNNPFILTNWTGIDPETENHQFSYPNVTSFSLGIDITF